MPATDIQRENQLWHLEVELLGQDSLFANVELTLMKAINDTTMDQVMKASTGYLKLKKGKKYSSKNKDLVLMYYNFSYPDFSRAYMETGLLPAGNYFAYYSVVEMNWEGQIITLAEKNIPVTVKPVALYPVK